MCGSKGKPEELAIDHIKPISLGGDMFDKNNLQTLCKRTCHYAKTKNDVRELTKMNREKADKLILENCIKKHRILGDFNA